MQQELFKKRKLGKLECHEVLEYVGMFECHHITSQNDKMESPAIFFFQ